LGDGHGQERLGVEVNLCDDAVRAGQQPIHVAPVEHCMSGAVEPSFHIQLAQLGYRVKVGVGSAPKRQLGHWRGGYGFGLCE
jgi:hypothetical protein